MPCWPHPHVVEGLRPGSAAEAAGLRARDQIISAEGVKEHIAHSASNVILQSTVNLIVDRGGSRIPITFSTEGPKIVEYKWVISPTSPSSCSLP